ncbi:MAG: hypothetical protein JW781_03710 [Deltaproteobacteria bacterium]|nr:hypothetical protein [Candidatus Anaeroferrophillacea bacterium]
MVVDDAEDIGAAVRVTVDPETGADGLGARPHDGHAHAPGLEGIVFRRQADAVVTDREDGALTAAVSADVDV